MGGLGPKILGPGWLIISIFAVIRSGHEYDLPILVNFIEKPPGSDAVSPSFGLPIPQLFDIRPYMGPFPELGINIISQLVFDLWPERMREVFEVL